MGFFGGEITVTAQNQPQKISKLKNENEPKKRNNLSKIGLIKII